MKNIIEETINDYSNDLNDYFEILREDVEFVKLEKIFNLISEDDYMEYVYKNRLCESDSIQWYLHNVYSDEFDTMTIYSNLDYSFKDLLMFHKNNLVGYVMDNVTDFVEEISDKTMSYLHENIVKYDED